MDALAGLLDGPRARGAFLLRSVLNPPWSIRIEDRAPLTLVTMVSGSGWMVPASGEAVCLRPGDVAIMRGPEPYTIADDPAHPWTVTALAAGTGVSRASLARRFAELVGEPPMSYLTGWRLSLAADLLREPDATIASVARQVGYGSPFALSTAFKRVRGVSPQEYRAG